MNRQEAKAVQQAFKVVEDWTVDLVASVMDSFAARVRDEARKGHRTDTMEALMAMARSAEEVAGQVRKELNQIREGRAHAHMMSLMIKTETETDG